MGFDTSAVVHLRSPSRSPPDAITGAFPPSLTTTVFSQRSMGRFEASLRRAAPKGRNLHHPSSIAPDHPPTSDSPSRSGHTTAPTRPSGPAPRRYGGTGGAPPPALPGRPPS